jgi:nucleotide-binding universal stress UspA family protein
MLRDHEGGGVVGRGERRANGFPARILLATDGSECAALATRAAMDLASRGGSELHVGHVWLDIHTSHFHAYVRRELHREGQEILDGQVGEIEASGGAVAGAHLREGHSVGEILALADELDAGLVVVGSRGMGPIHRLLLGSVSEGLAHRTTRPLLVVRGPWPPARVVIGDDYSEGAREAGDLAARVGALLGAEVALARVYPQARGTTPEEADASLDERAAELRGLLGRELPVERLAGDPAASILEMAERGGESVLISVGSRGGGVVDRLRLGSVSTRILRAAKGPVLISPHPSDRDVAGGSAGDVPRFLVARGLENSLHAAERAVDLSRLVGARLFVLTILQDPARSGGEDAARIAELAAKNGVDHEELTAAGDPVEAILDAARKVRVDYVLLDAEGLTMPGGVPQAVLKRADRPVLLIGGRARTHDPVLPGHEAASGETVG